jgi:hypothetical protein
MRAMLARCFHTTNAAIATLAARKGTAARAPSMPLAATAATSTEQGTDIAAIIDARLTMRNTARTTPQSTIASSAGSVRTGHIAASAPKPVATPLPPLKPIHGESVWPRIAASAVASQHHAVAVVTPPAFAPRAPSSQPAARTGIAPLSASIAKQAMPHARPSVRPRFVAP